MVDGGRPMYGWDLPGIRQPDQDENFHVNKGWQSTEPKQPTMGNNEVDDTLSHEDSG
jgi:hypothetical protein